MQNNQPSLTIKIGKHIVGIAIGKIAILSLAAVALSVVVTKSLGLW